MSKERKQNSFEKLFQTEPHKKKYFFGLIKIEYLRDTGYSSHD